MVNAMEWLYSQKRYNTIEKRREVKELDIRGEKPVIFFLERDVDKLEGHLDLRDFVNLTELICSKNNLTSLDVSGCVNLTILYCSFNYLTSIDFLNQLPNPEKLEYLGLANNDIARTNLEFLRPFVNLSKKLTLGNDRTDKYVNNIYNRFYGSLEPLRNVTKLPGLCIDGTDVEEGLEYLPTSVKPFNCSPISPNQKVEKIQKELRLFNYDLEAWQLAHPELMLKSRPEYFTNPDSRDKWLNALQTKIEKTQTELNQTKQKEADKLAKIARLEAKISELETAKSTISQQTQTEFSTQNKGTQTDLTLEQIEKWEQTENKKTLYQKYIEKYGKK